MLASISRVTAGNATRTLFECTKCSCARTMVRGISTDACRATGPVVSTTVRPAAPTATATSSIAPINVGSVRTLTSSSVRLDQWSNKTDVTYDELKPLTEQPTGEITIIDVREPAETQEGMIPSAVNLPLSELSIALKAEEDESNTHWFLEKYSIPPPKRSDKIIVYCRSGKRSQKALDYFASQGYKNLRNYRGSWLDWTEHKAKGQ